MRPLKGGCQHGITENTKPRKAVPLLRVSVCSSLPCCVGQHQRVIVELGRFRERVEAKRRSPSR